MKIHAAFVCLPALFLGLMACAPNSVAREHPAPLSTYAALPIKELTAFKDGHVCVLHEGPLPVDGEGNVVMDYLPSPLTGAFWPYCAEPHAHLSGTVSGQKAVRTPHTAMNLRELLEANIGAEAIFAESPTNHYLATILDLPARSAQELAATSLPMSPEQLPQKGSVVLLKTAAGIKALKLDSIQDVTFKDRPQPTVVEEEFRNLLTMRLDWGGARPSRTAQVGLFYVQKGVRWIPEYKLRIEAPGKASVQLQATLVNELADLEDVSVNLVIGVPTFAFKDTIDPIALQQNLAQVANLYDRDNRRLALNFNNAIMSQSMLLPLGTSPSAGPAGAELGPEIGGSARSEDLFVFNVPHVTLKKGQRLVVTVARFPLSFRDIFKLEIPFAPPAQVWENWSSEQQRELARQLASPKVLHVLRLTNDSPYPLTTAPALITRGNSVLAQGLMTYTSPGAPVDLDVTAAVDFQLKKTEHELKRTPNAFVHNGTSFARADMEGKLTLTSHHDKPADLEISRYTLGTVDSADHDGQIEKLNSLEDTAGWPAAAYPYGWSWNSWPSWWYSVNGVGHVSWKLTLEPGQSVDLNYAWHYFWP